MRTIIHHLIKDDGYCAQLEIYLRSRHFLLEPQNDRSLYTEEDFDNLNNRLRGLNDAFSSLKKLRKFCIANNP